MKEVCLSVKDPKPFLLTKENFEDKTGLKAPYYQKGAYYAVCPGCLSAVRITGLDGKGRKVFASHIPPNKLNSIEGLDFHYDADAYRKCPFHSDILQRTLACQNDAGEEERQSERLHIIWTQIDRIVFMWDRCLPFKASDFPAFAEIVLERLMGQTEAQKNLITETNLPWMLLSLASPLPIPIGKDNGNSALLPQDGGEARYFCVVPPEGEDSEPPRAKSRRSEEWVLLSGSLSALTANNSEDADRKLFRPEFRYWLELINSDCPRVERVHVKKLPVWQKVLEKVHFPKPADETAPPSDGSHAK